VQRYFYTRTTQDLCSSFGGREGKKNPHGITSPPYLYIYIYKSGFESVFFNWNQFSPIKANKNSPVVPCGTSVIYASQHQRDRIVTWRVLFLSYTWMYFFIFLLFLNVFPSISYTYIIYTYTLYAYTDARTRHLVNRPSRVIVVMKFKRTRAVRVCACARAINQTRDGPM